MSAVSASYDTGLSIEAPAKTALVASGLFHIMVAIIVTIGLPYVKPDRRLPPDPLPVEIMDIAEFTQTNKIPTRSESKQKKNDLEKPPEEKKEPLKKVAPQVTSKTPPKPVAPTSPDDVITPSDVKKAPEPPKKPAAKPKPKQPVLTQDTAEEEQEDFDSLLRNLMPTEEQASDGPSTAVEPGEKPSPLASLADRMTMSEMDALRRQLEGCWNLLAGARYAENLVVDIRLFMNPDRTIRSARILDQFRYNGDSYFRAAADSALSALRNPRCSPLDLPPGKYEQWKEIVVTFDPSEML
ncbi:MAG: energy transducer TonB [Rhodospirillales bacterium]|nr:energy transducer TonB [Rhodospirillales bacterium]